MDFEDIPEASEEGPAPPAIPQEAFVPPPAPPAEVYESYSAPAPVAVMIDEPYMPEPELDDALR